MLENNQAAPDVSQEPEEQSRPPETVSQYPEGPYPGVHAPQNVFITEGYTPSYRAILEKSEKTRQSRKLDD